MTTVIVEYKLDGYDVKPDKKRELIELFYKIAIINCESIKKHQKIGVIPKVIIK